MAFLLPLVESAAPMLLGSLLSPTLTRIGTKIDSKISPGDYGGNISRYGVRKLTTRNYKQQNLHQKHSYIGTGIMPQYGPAKGIMKKRTKKKPFAKGGFVTQLPLSNDNLTTSNQQV
jgi:hypothetical protein